MTSRADILGTKWVVIESEAETIRRIFRMYADGMSDYQICLQLNAEKVPATRKPRIGTMNTVWNCSLIKGILKRDKYVGRLIWNKTTQVVHPVIRLLIDFFRQLKKWDTLQSTRTPAQAPPSDQDIAA